MADVSDELADGGSKHPAKPAMMFDAKAIQGGAAAAKGGQGPSVEGEPTIQGAQASKQQAGQQVQQLDKTDEGMTVEQRAQMDAATAEQERQKGVVTEEQLQQKGAASDDQKTQEGMALAEQAAQGGEVTAEQELHEVETSGRQIEYRCRVVRERSTDEMVKYTRNTGVILKV